LDLIRVSLTSLFLGANKKRPAERPASNASG
jgi:hypothetical protein